MKTKSRREIIAVAKNLALEGSYDKALDKIDEFLSKNNDDIALIRLKGNVLALKANDYSVSSTSVASKYRADARQCYELILSFNNKDVLAFIDLGDLWREMNNHLNAIRYYNEALGLLKIGIFVESLKDEFEAAYRGKIEALRETKLGNQLTQTVREAAKDLPEILDW